MSARARHGESLAERGLLTEEEEAGFEVRSSAFVAEAYESVPNYRRSLLFRCGALATIAQYDLGGESHHSCGTSPVK